MTSGVGSIEELSNVITAAPFEINGDGFGSGITAPTDGTLLRTNLCTNPSFETNTTGWTAGTGVTLSQESGFATPISGSYSLKLSRLATSASASHTVTGLVSGHVYTVSCYAFQNTDATFAITAGTAGSLVTPGGAWARATKTFTASGTSQLLTFTFTAAVTVGIGLIDAVQIEESATATDYFDGDTVDTDNRAYAWSGTANASKSTESMTFTELVSIDTATELDQIVLTRDSNPGVIAFEDPEGTIQIFDSAVARTGAAAHTIGPSNYSNIDVAYDMSHIINVLTLKKVEKIKRGKKPTRKVEIELVFTDDASIAKYGKFKKTLTIHNKTDFSDYAAKIFARNADPQEVPRSVTIPVKEAADLLPGYEDGHYVGSKVDVVLPDGTTTYTCRVARIAHEITPGTWMVTVYLRNQNVIQRPRPDGIFGADFSTEVANNPDGSIEGAHFDDDVDATGKTFTRATNQTSDSGNRIVMRDDGSEGIIEFYSGLAGETKGRINPGVTSGGSHKLDIQTSSVLPNQPALARLTAGTTGDLPTMQLVNTSLKVDKNAVVDGNLTVNAPVTVDSLNIQSMPTGGSANVNYSTSTGQIRLVTSARRFKTDIDALDVDVDQALLLEPTIYTRIESGEREVGFIADDAEALGLTPWVVYDTDGTVLSFDYFKWVVALQATNRAQQQQIRDLGDRVAALESLVQRLTEEA